MKHPKKEKYIGLRLTADQYDKIKEQATKQGVKVSELVLTRVLGGKRP